MVFGQRQPAAKPDVIDRQAKHSRRMTGKVPSKRGSPARVARHAGIGTAPGRRVEVAHDDEGQRRLSSPSLIVASWRSRSHLSSGAPGEGGCVVTICTPSTCVAQDDAMAAHEACHVDGASFARRQQRPPFPFPLRPLQPLARQAAIGKIREQSRQIRFLQFLRRLVDGNDIRAIAARTAPPTVSIAAIEPCTFALTTRSSRASASAACGSANPPTPINSARFSAAAAMETPATSFSRRTAANAADKNACKEEMLRPVRQQVHHPAGPAIDHQPVSQARAPSRRQSPTRQPRAKSDRVPHRAKRWQKTQRAASSASVGSMSPS